MKRLVVAPLAAVAATGCAMRPWTPSVSVAYATEDVPTPVATPVRSTQELVERWMLPAESPWSRYAKMTLLTSIEGAGPLADLPDVAELEVVQRAELAAGRIAAAGVPRDVLFVVDLRGAASVAFGVALSRLARSPVAVVPTFHNWPDENELVPAEETLAAMVTRAPKLPSAADADATPVFLLDAWRLAFRDGEPGDDVVDNRYFLTSSDLPDAETLRERGIHRVVYVVESLDDTETEEDDVHEAALGWQAAGVPLHLVDLSWLEDRGPRWTDELVGMRIVVVPRATIVADPAFYARARGGFGGLHGHASPIRVGGHVLAHGHGGG